MTTQPAGEHHTGSLDLTGEGNAPASDDDAIETAPRTAADLIQEAARVINWRPDEKYPLQARYDAARALASMYAYWTAVTLETLRRLDPAAAERVTTHIDDDLDWANAHEHAYGWEQTLDAGGSIAADAWPFWEITGGQTDIDIRARIIADLTTRRAEITEGRPGWVYLTEAIGIAERGLL
jgi:hypothetical protein